LRKKKDQSRLKEDGDKVCVSLRLPIMHSYSLLLLLAVVAMASAAKTDEKFILGLLSESCYETFFSQHDFLNAPCLKLTLSKVLSFGILAGSVVYKLPQVIKLYRAKNAEGMSLTSIYMETGGFILAVCYNAMQGNPFSTYGEGVFVIVQNAAIIVMIWSYRTDVEGTHKLGVFTLMSLLAVFLLKFWWLIPPSTCCAAAVAGTEPCCAAVHVAAAWPPSPVFCCPVALTAQFPITLVSRIPQILQIFGNGHTGQLSFVSTFLNWAGGAARIFTTLQETSGTMQVIVYVMSFGLNCILVGQLVFLWKATNEWEAKQAADKKK